MIGRPQLQRFMRTSLVSLILAIFVLPAVALRDCPMMGAEDACCCCEGDSGQEEDIARRTRMACCDTATAAPSIDALAETAAPVHLARSIVPAPLVPPGPALVRKLPPRVRGPPGPASPPVYLLNQSLLL